MKKATRNAVSVLARETGLPLFVSMAERRLAVPMVVGIDKAVAAIAMAKGGELAAKRAGRALHQLVMATCYQTALTIGGAGRHDVDGKVVEPVTAEHRAHAWTRLQERRASAQRAPDKPLSGAGVCPAEDARVAAVAAAIVSRPADRRAAATVKAVGMYRLLLLREMHGATEATIEAAVESFRVDVARRVAAMVDQSK